LLLEFDLGIIAFIRMLILKILKENVNPI